MANPFPFSAIVGQEDMKLAFMIAAVDASVGGVLAFGDRGAGKSTAVRALAALLPKIKVAVGCPYNCEPSHPARLCGACQGETKPKTAQRSAPVVDLPLGATEDRVVGALNLERALSTGEKHFEPGLLAQANRGFLYIDEANLLEDHLVDLLLDVAASGVNLVEREGLSIRHPARFVLIGSGNPEEGELRPQMLDRFGLAVDVKTPRDIAERIEVIKRRDAFDRDPDAFHKTWEGEEKKLRAKITHARERIGDIATPDAALERAARLCLALGTDGLRGELTLIRAGRAYAALEGGAEVSDAALKRVAPMALSHRLRRNPLDETGSAARVERALAEVFGP
jgi:magnesium chelatase subunit I